jgi:hypothetical protein
MLDAFFGVTDYHMNVNLLNRDMLLDAIHIEQRRAAHAGPVCREAGLLPPQTAGMDVRTVLDFARRLAARKRYLFWV